MSSAPACLPAAHLSTRLNGRRVTVAGLVILRQRPGTASGVIFMTLEDEDGHINLVIFSHVWERYQNLIRDSLMLIAEGEVQRTGRVVNLICEHFAPLEGSDPGVMVSRNFF